MKKKRGSPRKPAILALRRQWEMGMVLQKRYWSCFELAREFGISKATAQRDLDLLSALFKVVFKHDPKHDQRLVWRMQGRFVPRKGPAYLFLGHKP